MKKKIIIGIGILGMIAVLFLLAMPGGSGCGSKGVTFNFYLLDSSMGHPIKNAEIRVLGPTDLLSSDYPELREALIHRRAISHTDEKGKAELFSMCGAGWSLHPLGGGTLRVGQLLQISADGYHPVEVPLESVVGGPRWSVSKDEFDIEMYLIKKKANNAVDSTASTLRAPAVIHR